MIRVFAVSKPGLGSRSLTQIVSVNEPRTEFEIDQLKSWLDIGYEAVELQTVPLETVPGTMIDLKRIADALEIIAGGTVTAAKPAFTMTTVADRPPHIDEIAKSKPAAPKPAAEEHDDDYVEPMGDD